jgi:hypothetical protein
MPTTINTMLKGDSATPKPPMRELNSSIFILLFYSTKN